MFQKLHAHFLFRLRNKWFEFNKASKYNVLLVHISSVLWENY